MSSVLVGVSAGLLCFGVLASWRWLTARLSDAPLGWDALPIRRRRAIRRAVLRGQAIDGTPDEARAAADLAARLMRRMSSGRRVLLACLFVASTCCWLFLGETRHQSVWFALAMLYGVLTPVQAWRSWRTARRLRAAYKANSEFAYGPA